jgi:7,8-dihydropterin-6-yl-methyl-4-(beta-D-ribofuranosyl)aminobenzene 5'-phosphate synthase
MIIKLIASGSRRWDLLRRRKGISYLVDGDVLFDTFASSRVLFRNFHRFGNDIDRVRHVVISHDHWNHTGGLWKLLKRVPRVTVHAPETVSNDFKKRVQKYGGRVVEGRQGHYVKEGVYVSCLMAGTCNGKTVPEQALVLEADGRLMVLSGYGHPGIPHMVEQVNKTFKAPVYGVMGGFHYGESYSNEQIRKSIQLLKEFGVEMVGPAHRIGDVAEIVCRETFLHNCVTLREGQSVSFGKVDS